MEAERKKAGIYTKTGDGGKTGLSGKQRVSKADVRICALGSIDELNSCIGLMIALVHWDNSSDREKKFFISLQNDLFEIGSELSGSENVKISTERISVLEEKIDEISASLEPLKNFILPGGYIRAAWLHFIRTICRRAERDVCRVSDEEHINKDIIVYLNRLSDMFFVIARLHNASGRNDILWKP